jgi:plastocyanin
MRSHEEPSGQAGRIARIGLAVCAGMLATAAVVFGRSLPGAVGRPSGSHRVESSAAAPTAVSVRLSEWKVDLSRRSVPAGQVTFTISNAGSIPHAFEVEGRGLEREVEQMAPGGTRTLTLNLRPGSYEVYCPVGDDSHKKLGMVATLVVTRAGAATARGSYSRTAPEDASMHGAMGGHAGMGQVAEAASTRAPRTLRITGGGPVVQILPGPFPFADSAAAVIRTRPADQQADLAAKTEHGPYSNEVARVSGTVTITATDRGASGDTVSGEAQVATQDGAHWRIVMDRVQTRDIPFNPRFGGVIMGLYYHGASNVHTPLVPTINSAVALWAYAHVYRNGELVTDDALVHVMLLSRTRREGDFHLACWSCARNPVEELQLQVTTAPGQPKLDAPGGFLFVNWEKSAAAEVRGG